MVSKDFNQIIQEIKIEDENAINQKEIQSFTLENLNQKENNINNKEEFINIPTKIEKEESINKIKNESKNENKEVPKIEIKEELKNENKEELKNEIKEEPKDKTQKKKKRHNKKKNKKHTNIFEIPQTNPYRSLFDFKEVSKSRFQDNSIFRLINNWEEKEWLQTTPPTKDIDEQFPTQLFPQGEIQPYSK